MELKPEESEHFKKIYNAIRKKWQGLVSIIPGLSEFNFNSSEDRINIEKALTDFGKAMSFLLKEINLDHAPVEGQLKALATVEDYEELIQNLRALEYLFDKYKPDFEQLAKKVDLERNPDRGFTSENLKKASDSLNILEHLLVKNKNKISETSEPEMTTNTEPSVNEPSVTRKTVNDRAPTPKANVHSAVKTLIEAANRLDLRPPTQRSKEQLAELLAYMKALRECYQAMHWVSRGEPYYGDHQLFSRLYESIAAEVDSLAEKAIGYTDDAYVVEVQYQTSRVATHVSEIMSFLPDMTNIQCMLNAEKKLSKEIVPKILNDLEQAGELSDGLESFLQTIADAHEQIIYHIQRRLKTQKDLNEMSPVEPNISPPPEPTDDIDNEFDTMVDDDNVV